MVFVYGCEIRRLLRLNTKGFRNIYKFNLTSVTKLKQNSYNDSAIYRKIQFSSRWCFCPKIQQGKKSREKSWIFSRLLFVLQKLMSRHCLFEVYFLRSFSAMLCDLHDSKTIENYFWLELWGFVQAFVFVKDDGNYA